MVQNCQNDVVLACFASKTTLIIRVYLLRNDTGKKLFCHLLSPPNLRLKMAFSSTNNSNIRLRPRICDCGKTAAMYIVRTNENGNQGRVFFVCPSKYIR
ncbi:hypothetical protein ACSBR1_025567 [Camellia fascicularis]